MLKIKAYSGGYDKNFSYLIWCNETNQAALVDPATDPLPIISTLTEQRLTLDKILITHTHPDHMAYHSQWLQRFPTICSYGTMPVNRPSGRYEPLPDKSAVPVGDQVVRVIHTPGHFPDCVCWYAEGAGAIFTGDTIFIGRPGRVVGALSDISLLYTSVYERIYALPVSTRVYPGHDYGADSTATLAELRAAYPFFACQSEAEFIRQMAIYEESRKEILQ